MESDNTDIIFSEAVFCDICGKLFESISKCIHLKALSYEEFDIYKHIKLTIKNTDINEINDRIDSYISEHDKK